MNRREFNQAKAVIIDLIDTHMPGYRIGGPPRPNHTVQATADVTRLREELREWSLTWEATRPHMGLGITSIERFVVAHGLPTDTHYVREFRRQAIFAAMRETESAAN